MVNVTIRRAVLGLALAAVVWLGSGIGGAIAWATPGPHQKHDLHSAARATKLDSKVGPLLQRILLTSQHPGGSDPAQVRQPFNDSGDVQVYIYVTSTSRETLAALRAVGAQVEIVETDAGTIQAWIPAKAVKDLASVDTVRQVRLPDYAIPRAGSANTEGDAIHRSNLVRLWTDLQRRRREGGESSPTAWTRWRSPNGQVTFLPP